MRDGTLARGDFIPLAGKIRRQIQAILQESADYKIAAREQTPRAKTVRTFRQPPKGAQLEKFEEDI